MTKYKNQVETKRVQTKGAVIKLMTGKLPGKMLTDLLFRSDIKKYLGACGLYALYNKKRLYYVGLSTNLSRRLNKHLNDHHKNKWNEFSVYVLNNKRHIKDIETIILRIANPRGNRVNGRVPKSKDLNRKLRKRLNELQRGLAGYKRPLSKRVFAMKKR